MYSTEDILRLFLPSWIFDYFELDKFTQNDSCIDVYLSDKKLMPDGKPDTFISYGFTDYSIF
jgi:hypothetical protein